VGRDERSISRRDFARTAAAAALAVVGCERRSSLAIHLRFWNGFTGPDGRTMLRIIKQFNQQHENIQVTMQRMDWGTYYNKLFVAGLGNRAPDVFVLHSDQIDRFYRAGLMTPIDAMLTDGRVPMDDLDPNVLAKTSRAGKHYALPLDVHPLGMFYNRRLFADAGIAKAPQTQKEFVEALHRLKRAGDGGVAQWGFVLGWFRVIMYSIMSQYGGRIFDDATGALTLDSPACREAMSFMAGLIVEQKLVPEIENLAGMIGFRQGRVAMVWEGIFMLPELRRQTDLEFGAAPLVIVGNQPAVWAGTHNLCIRNGLDDRQTRAAMTFLKFLSDHSLDWADGGQIPVRRSLRQTERFAAMTAQAAFATQIPYVTYMPSTPFTVEYQVEFDLACDRVLRGSATPQQALADATTNIQRVMTRYEHWNTGSAP